MFLKTEQVFFRTIQAIKFYNISKPNNFTSLQIADFTIWLDSIEKNETLQWIYEFELEKLKFSKRLPINVIYEKNRWNNINKFQTLVNDNSILDGLYEFNNFCEIVYSENLNMNIHNFNLDFIEQLKTESYILIRKSITHNTGIFEMELKGWNRLLIDLETYDKPISGTDIFNNLKDSFDVKKAHVEKFLSNNVVYYDSINVVL